MAHPAPHDDDEEPGIFDIPDDEADEAAMARAEEDFAAGRTISHDAMKRWLLSWGTDNPLPPPKCGE
ncbi:MAG: CopG family transcriptional regulator [Pseudomonadota bacterium]|uniref:CopG family transcriptional regulator n=1 Tax=uncultured Brevundimonas sp. TaxID=213418 RepID=UPI0025EE49B2|nr:CopG family transcriptional regulator [Brevundimonas sp.]MEE2850928.1 CopG family transcriptional regulator [Pseudomonadota bacterium]